MIGAMPAVAVRHQRGNKIQIDKKGRLIRPRSLSVDHRLVGACSHSPTHDSALQGAARAPDPLQPCSCDCGILCGRLSLLHLTVVLVLLGVTLLVVGMVQLASDTATGAHKYAMIGTGVCMLALGSIFLFGMCLFQRCHQQTHLPEEIGSTKDFASIPLQTAQSQEDAVSNHEV